MVEVRDVAVRTKQRLGLLSHPVYWQLNRDGTAPSCVERLREALDLGLGGKYSEEICLRAGIDKGKKDVTSAEMKKITDAQ